MLLCDNVAVLATSKDYIVVDSTYGHLLSKTSVSAFVLLQHKERQEEYVVRLVEINRNRTCETTLKFGIFVQKQFVDLDGDGYKDVVIKTLSGEPLDIVLLYKDGCLKQLATESGQFIGEVLKLRNGFLFDYKGVGCADNTWETTLFSIQKGKLLPFAEIRFDKCQNELITFKLVRTIKQQTLTDQQKSLLRRFHQKKDMTTLGRFWQSIVI